METLEYLDKLGLAKDTKWLELLDDEHSAHCCDCKFDDGQYRVWVCRVARGVTVESLINGSWATVSGGCEDIID